MKKTVMAVGLIATAALSAQEGATQERPNVPNSVPSREQVLPPTPQPLRPTPSVKVDASHAIRTAPCPLESSPVRVVLSTVRFAQPDDKPLVPEIARALAGVKIVYPGDHPISAVCYVRDAANAALRRKGYIASVQIPPQSITNGELKLTVVTARITEIRVHGEAGHYRDALLARIAKLKALDPLNERDAERILLLASDIPGLSVQLSLRPAGTVPGAVIGDLTITRRRFVVLGNVQNYGSHELGRYTGYARGEYYGLLTASDVAYIGLSSTAQTHEQQVAQVGYTTGLFSGGATIGGRFSYAWSRPDLGQLDLRSRSLIGGIDLSVPLIRSLDSNLSVGGGGEIIEQRTRVYTDSGSSPLNLDKLRVLFLRSSGSVRARQADGKEIVSLAGAVEVRKGLGVLGATPRGQTSTGSGYTPSRFNADPQALVVRANVDGVVHAGPFSAATDVKAQWSNHALLNFEEFSIGNLTSGRGYDPGSNSGDRAVGLANELRFDIGAIHALPIQLFGFGDIVWLWNLDQNTTERYRRLRSAGGGARVTLPGRMFLELSYARPFDKPLSISPRKPPGRVLMSLTAQFAPVAR